MADPPSFTLPTEPKGVEYPVELAIDLRGTWEHTADELWGQLDPELWRMTLNPWAVLQALSHTRLKAVAADPKFHQMATAPVRARQRYLEAPPWFRPGAGDAFGRGLYTAHYPAPPRGGNPLGGGADSLAAVSRVRSERGRDEGEPQHGSNEAGITERRA
jgi:hypothetical protein